MNSQPLRLARLAMILVVFTLSARLIPTGGALGSSPIAGPDARAALLDRFDDSDRPIVARGRSSALVGTGAPSLTFRPFGGGTLAYDGLDRIVVLAFLGPRCDRCRIDVQKLATLSVVYYEDIYTVGVASAGTGRQTEQLIANEGGGGLVVGAEDIDNTVAKGLQITKRPTLVVVGPKGIVDAIWTEDVPLNVLFRFLKVAYDIERSGQA